jgi:hypothetical protein
VNSARCYLLELQISFHRPRTPIEFDSRTTKLPEVIISPAESALIDSDPADVSVTNGQEGEPQPGSRKSRNVGRCLSAGCKESFEPPAIRLPFNGEAAGFLCVGYLDIAKAEPSRASD